MNDSEKREKIIELIDEIKNAHYEYVEGTSDAEEVKRYVEELTEKLLDVVFKPKMHVKGYRHFDSKNGNTYCAAEVYMDNRVVAVASRQYGYGDFYLQAAQEALRDRGIIKQERHKNGSWDPLWRYCQENGIEFSYEVQDDVSWSQLGEI